MAGEERSVIVSGCGTGRKMSGRINQRLLKYLSMVFYAIETPETIQNMRVELVECGFSVDFSAAVPERFVASSGDKRILVIGKEKRKIRKQLETLGYRRAACTQRLNVLLSLLNISI